MLQDKKCAVQRNGSNWAEQPYFCCFRILLYCTRESCPAESPVESNAFCDRDR